MSRSTANLYVGANHQLTFGKHKGKLLGDLIDEDYSYILYLHKKKILKIEQWIVDKCECKSFDDIEDQIGLGYSYEFWKND
jgi:hypothetical protein